MRQLFEPDLRIQNIHALDLAHLKERGIRGIIFDVDNTLESHRTKTPKPETVQFIRRAQREGFRVCLISNGKQKRVDKFNRRLRLPAVAKANKPLKKNFLAALSMLDTTRETTAVVGDQIFTDVLGGNRLGLYTVWVEPIEPIENGFFYLKRFFERFVNKSTKE